MQAFPTGVAASLYEFVVLVATHANIQLNLLLCKRKPPIGIEGIHKELPRGPLSWLKLRYKLDNRVKLENVVGTVPEKALDRRSKVSKLVSNDNSEGILPNVYIYI